MSERRVALVIGNENYHNAGLLFNPKNDAEAIASVLTSLAFEVIKKTDLDFVEMNRSISAFEDTLLSFDRGGTQCADVAMLFYAGHGLQVKGENYLLPTDANIELETHLQWQAVPLTKIMEVMSGRARTSLVFLDACRNNPFTERLARALAMAQGPRNGDAAASVAPGLAQPRALPDGSFIAFSTAPGSVSQDGRGKNSPFTLALVEHMPTPNITVDDMMTRVTASVLEQTKRLRPQQRPWKQSDLDAPFYFRRTRTRRSSHSS